LAFAKAKTGIYLMLKHALAAATIVCAALAASPAPAADYWPHDFFGCEVYEHRGFKGAKLRFAATRTYRYVGSRWNDRISSIHCTAYCTITVWEHRDYTGATHTFGDYTEYVGGGWNDKISSMKATCEQ
jgi:hypothetical protein